jgi:hypothetical protein
MILQGSAKILTEAVTKSNRLRKCWTINEGGRFMTASQNRLTEAVALFTEAVRKYPPTKIDFCASKNSYF